MFSKSQIKNRGWNPYMIAYFLGKPVVIGYSRIHRSKIKYYYKSEVLKIEKTEEFLEMQAFMKLNSKY